MKDLDALSEIDNSETILKLSVRDFQIFNELYQSRGQKIVAYNLNISRATIHRSINNIENAFKSQNLFGVRGSNSLSAITRRIYESSSKIVRLLEGFVPVMKVVYNHPDFEKLTMIELLRAVEIFYRSQLRAWSLAKERRALEKRSKLEKQDKIAEADSNIHFYQERRELARIYLDDMCALSPMMTTVPS
ncbi:hypothetical protein [Sphingomonas mollis]|uniref:Uncharacterized protein n=1 Tax=Sphingomonas mollis TaxID=2795726 RepID=A0ABS0XMX1_9SPHN|nr:hypothetical protein [Sphingomonas sp. BT553]MBJ6121375.1 hypothetical protein [Sphingomonas sp. BT553]